jgi:hypothetical protein
MSLFTESLFFYIRTKAVGYLAYESAEASGYKQSGLIA